jgi:V/A-type H+-transporting ATPase subunit F
MQVMVIGHPQAVLGFSLVGVHGLAAITAEQANQALERAFSTPDIGIILVTEDAANLIGPRMDQLRLRSTIPLVVEIPGPGTAQTGRPTLNEVVLRAIGVKI